MLARFRTLRPGVEVAIRAATDVGELHCAVEAGELDICFTVLPDLPPRQLVAMWHRDRHLGATTRAFLDAATEIWGGGRPGLVMFQVAQDLC